MRKYPDVYDKKALLKCIVGLILLAVAMKFTTGAGFLILIPFVFVALFSNKSASLFYYLLMTIAAVICNAWIMPKGSVFAVAQRGMMMILGGILVLKLPGQRHSPSFKPFLLLILYLLSMIVSSVQGWCPVISYLKLLLFTTIFFAYYGICNQMAMDQSSNTLQVRSVMLSFACFFILGSMALIPFPGISQLSGEEYLEAVRSGHAQISLFKGMTMHSQCLGPCIAIIFAVLFADFVFSVLRPDKLYLLLMLCCPVLIYKTSSRTAMGALIAAVFMTIWLSMKDRGVGQRWRSKIISTIIWIVAMGAICVLAIPSTREGVMKYALKKTDVGKDDKINVEDVLVSRQGKWEEGIANFKKSPMLGNGFQVSEEMQGITSFGVLSAPVEKSVWISAVLEEGGVAGFVLFCIFVLCSYTVMVKRKAYIGATAFVIMLVSNLGEFSMFSLSYTGGLQWGMVFAGLVMDAERMKEQRRYGAQWTPRWHWSMARGF